MTAGAIEDRAALVDELAGFVASRPSRRGSPSVDQPAEALDNVLVPGGSPVSSSAVVLTADR